MAGTAATGALAGCAGDDGDATATTRTATDEDGATTSPVETTAADGSTDLVGAIEREAIPIDLGDPSGNMDAAASTLAESPIVGIGETSHGVREFKTAPDRLVRRLVADHGYRLLAMEGTLGDFAPVNAYITRGEGDLETALSALEFYFWRTEEIRAMFEWLREFNDGRPEADTVVVRGYDAQHFDTNATAVRSYLERVDADYLAEVEDSLDPLTTPLYHDSEADLVTDARMMFIEDLGDRLAAREAAYVEATSRSEWRLARRHVRTLERGLRFQTALRDHAFARGKSIRDEAMANNVTWLREWTGSDRVVVLGNANHTMGGYGHPNEQGARMGQHLREEYGSDYYSLGLVFGSGSFSAPTGDGRTEFGTFDLGGPVEGTLAATLATVSQSPLFLDFAAARERPTIETWLGGLSEMGFTTPRAPQRGAQPIPGAPGELLDGVVFVRDVSPATFSG